jgi:hypothetical protein
MMTGPGKGKKNQARHLANDTKGGGYKVESRIMTTNRRSTDYDLGYRLLCLA